MAIFSIRNQRFQQRTTIKSNHGQLISGHKSTGRNRGASNKSKLLSRFKWSELYNLKSWGSIPVHSNLQRSWGNKPDCDSKSNRSYFGNRYHKYLYPVIALLVSSPVSAAEVGGVSATANPIANSSGSVTNQAIQVLQGPYITNTYGGGISCQGPTMNFTPYITHARNDKDPFETFYMEPQYDARDFEGRMVEVQKNVKNYPWESWYDNRTYINADGDEVRAFEDGADMTITVMEMQGDGVPDNPGAELWQKPVRTGMSRNYSTSLGLSATLSLPLDGGLQERCKQAADTQIALQQQMTANKRLDFEIARLKNCGELMKAGITFHPKSRYAAICADVVVQNVNYIKPHLHTIPSPSVSESRDSESSVQQSSQTSIVPGSSYPVRSQSSSLPSSQSVSPLLTKDQQEVLRAVPTKLPPRQ